MGPWVCTAVVLDNREQEVKHALLRTIHITTQRDSIRSPPEVLGYDDVRCFRRRATTCPFLLFASSFLISPTTIHSFLFRCRSWVVISLPSSEFSLSFLRPPCSFYFVVLLRFYYCSLPFRCSVFTLLRVSSQSLCLCVHPASVASPCFSLASDYSHRVPLYIRVFAKTKIGFGLGLLFFPRDPRPPDL